MKIFNLHGDDWDRAEERKGWRSKEAWVPNRIGAELIGGSMSELEPGDRTRSAEGERILLSRPGPILDYWDGED